MEGFSDGEFEHEVMVCRNGRWVVDALAIGEEEAVSVAQTRLRQPGPSSNRVEAVRVIAVKRSRSGFVSRCEIFTQQAQAPTTRISARSTTFVNQCEMAEDLAGLESRMVMARVLRDYLDRHRITPTELLHTWRHLKKLQETDNLLSSTFHQIAKAQVNAARAVQARLNRDLADRRGTDNRSHPQGGGAWNRKDRSATGSATAGSDPGDDDLGRNAPARREAHLWAMGQAVAAKARDFSGLRNRPRLNPERMTETSRLVESAFGENTWWARRAMVAEWAGQFTSIEGKMEAALSLLDAGAAPFEDEVEELLADCLSDPSALKEALGYHHTLFSCLNQMAGVLTGQCPEGALTPTMSAVSRLLKTGRGREARVVLTERLISEISRDHPLDRFEPKRETLLVQELIGSMLTRDGKIVGGEFSQQALSRRIVRGQVALQQAMGLHEVASQTHRTFEPDIAAMVARAAEKMKEAAAFDAADPSTSKA